MLRPLFASLFAGAVLVNWVAAVAQQPAAQRPATENTGQMMTSKALPADKIQGLNVKNTQGEDLGTVEDVVINLNDGRVAYIALSHGGLLGVGDKLFAVPFQELKVAHDAANDQMQFVLDISKEKLQAAPGFDKNNWPDFANQQWRDQINRYYQQERGTERSAAKPVLP